MPSAFTRSRASRVSAAPSIVLAPAWAGSHQAATSTPTQTAALTGYPRPSTNSLAQTNEGRVPRTRSAGPTISATLRNRGGVMARTPLTRAFELLARDHDTAEAVGIG